MVRNQDKKQRQNEYAARNSQCVIVKNLSKFTLCSRFIKKDRWRLYNIVRQAIPNIDDPVGFRVNTPRLQRRSEGGAGRTGRHLLGAANGRKLFLKIHVKIQVVISDVFACNKNKALHAARTYPQYPGL